MNLQTAPIKVDHAVGPDTTVVQAYRPAHTPWTAKRKGTERLVWYVIFDSTGEEVCNTGSVLLEDERGMLAQVLLILSSVNGSSAVEIDGKQVEVIWR